MLNFVFSSTPHTLESRTQSSNESLHQTFQEIFEEPVKVVRPQKSIVNGLLQQAELIIPRYNNFKKQLSELEDNLLSCFAKRDINLSPSFDISVDFENNCINVWGDRNDSIKIESLLNGTDELRKKTQQVYAIGSQLINIADSIAFREEYCRSNRPDEVILKYSELFNDYRRMKDFSLRFDKRLIILCDKEIWSFPLKES